MDPEALKLLKDLSGTGDLGIESVRDLKVEIVLLDENKAKRIAQSTSLDKHFG